MGTKIKMYYRSLVDGHAPGIEKDDTRISSKHTSRVGAEYAAPI